MNIKDRLGRLERPAGTSDDRPLTRLESAIRDLSDDELEALVADSTSFVDLADISPAVRNAIIAERSENEH